MSSELETYPATGSKTSILSDQNGIPSGLFCAFSSALEQLRLDRSPIQRL